MILLWLGCAVDPVLDLQGDAAVGSEIYGAECALCHGLQGEGTSRGIELQGVFSRRTDSEVLDIVRFGTGDMPAYTFTDQELADLLGWMKAEWP